MKLKLYKLPKTKIPWADYVWNISTGCDKVSSGCKNCFAEVYAIRFWKGRAFNDVQFHANRTHFAPLKTASNVIFVDSMSDLFHSSISINKLISVMEEMSNHRDQYFVILTKRPKAALKFFNNYPSPPNLILGVSVEDNITAQERLDILLKTPVKYRMVSIEPYLPWKESTKKISQASEVILSRYINSGFTKKGALGRLDWVIVGAESGPKKRYCDELFIKNIVASCLIAGVPVFVKQIHSKKDSKGKFKVISNPYEFSQRLQFRNYPSVIAIERYMNGKDLKEWVRNSPGTGVPKAEVKKAYKDFSDRIIKPVHLKHLENVKIHSVNLTGGWTGTAEVKQ